jgi:hypothetical protein
MAVYALFSFDFLPCPFPSSLKIRKKWAWRGELQEQFSEAFDAKRLKSYYFNVIKKPTV